MHGAEIRFDGVTVTGTENLMMAATLADGTTKLTNVAKEPEIIDLADMLNSMGAKIKGAGSDEIIIEGVNNLNGTVFDIPADRIEAGTYLVAAAVTKGDITVDGINPERLMTVINKLENTGAKLSYDKTSISISMKKVFQSLLILLQPRFLIFQQICKHNSLLLMQFLMELQIFMRLFLKIDLCIF